MPFVLFYQSREKKEIFNPLISIGPANLDFNFQSLMHSFRDNGCKDNFSYQQCQQIRQQIHNFYPLEIGPFGSKGLEDVYIFNGSHRHSMKLASEYDLLAT